MSASNLPENNSLAAWLQRGALQLRDHSDSARLDAELLLAHLLQKPRSFLLANGGQPLEEILAKRFLSWLARRGRGEPLAYITGEREFWSMTLSVTPAVLVPRPETELLVERALHLLPDQAAEVADLGTGSGAVALACARERPHWHITATDISAAALQMASANARRLALHKVSFMQGSWFEPLGERRFAMLLSNPPYVGAADPALAGNLRFEPAIALGSGVDGLDALRLICAGARAHLEPGGWLVLEHGSMQAAAVAALLVSHGYAHVRCHPDLAGLDRVTEAQRRNDGTF